MIGRREFLKSTAAAGIMATSGKAASGAAGSGRADSGTAVPVPLSYEIPHTRTTTPIQDARIYPMSSPFSRTDTRTGLTRNGHLYAAGSGYLWASRDRGRTWTMRKLPVGTGGGFGILNGDVFILIHDAPDHSVTYVQRSTDYGETWSERFPLDVSPYTFSGSGWSDVYQHPDGTAMITVTLRHRDGVNEWDNPQVRGFHDHIFRSRDGGRSWGDRTLILPYSAESTLMAVKDSNRMLAYIRAQRPMLPEDPPGFRKRTGATPTEEWVLKNGVVAESVDGGRTWLNPRLFDLRGSVPGEFVQVPDGRIAAIWLQRYPYELAEIRARISSDGGRTWGPATYSLMHGHGYPDSVVYPDGTIVTVCENTDLSHRGRVLGSRTMASLHWRLPGGGTTF